MKFHASQQHRSLAHVMNDFDDYVGQRYPAMDGAKDFPISITVVEKTPGNTSTRNTDPTGDQTRTR